MDGRQLSTRRHRLILMMREVAGGASFLCVAGVLSVSAFAQTNTGARMLAFERSAAGIVREYVPASRSAYAELALPANLRAPAAYRRLLESMLAHSPTFRQQCRRLENTASIVTVQIQQAGRPLHGAGARTRISRRDGNHLEATVEIGREGDPVELVAHEVEHVIEQLDEIDLQARASVEGSGVRRGPGSDAAFETTRAIRIGRKVAEEVRSGGG
jgi:hypothetical protein